MDYTLRKALWGFLRPLVQLLTNLLSPGVGEEWEREFKKFLRKEPCWDHQEFELYLAPGQENGGSMMGFDLEKHLEETKLINRTFSLDDELVKGWIANPSSYPEEFKGKAIFLWKSRRTSGSDRTVAYLYWRGDRVIVHWDWLEGRWYGGGPALLEPVV